MSYKPKIMPNVIAQASAWSGLTSMNHLGAIYGNNKNNKMRRPERIPIVLANIEWDKYLSHVMGVDNVGDDTLKELFRRLPELEERWKENPDWRLGQLLSNENFMESSIGWNVEEVDYMIDSGMLEARDITFWGVNYTKDMVKLPETEFRLIKDLETAHIEAILGKNDMGRKWVKEGSAYETYFENELERRENELINDDDEY
jgi:hypothetical protein